MKVQVIYSRGVGPIAWLICFLTWSRWSHVGIITPDGNVIDAYFPKVRECTLAKFKSKAAKVQIEEYFCPDPEDLFDWLYEQVGKPYDWRALFGFMFRSKSWNQEDEWFCSELVSAAFQKHGLKMFRESRVKRISPEDLYKINPDIGSW